MSDEPLIRVTVGSRYANHGGIRLVERESIERFLGSCTDVLGGRVLDYGCGRQPYRAIVESAGGEYVPFDRAEFPANVSGEDVGPDHPLYGADTFDAILCNQMVQYVPVYDDRYHETGGPLWDLLRDFQIALERNERETGDPGHLVLTFPTCWDEVEPDDLHRFTRAGMTHLLETAGFTVERVQRRADVELGGFRFPLGYGIVARG